MLCPLRLQCESNALLLRRDIPPTASEIHLGESASRTMPSTPQFHPSASSRSYRSYNCLLQGSYHITPLRLPCESYTSASTRYSTFGFNAVSPSASMRELRSSASTRHPTFGFRDSPWRLGIANDAFNPSVSPFSFRKELRELQPSASTGATAFGFNAVAPLASRPSLLPIRLQGWSYGSYNLRLQRELRELHLRLQTQHNTIGTLSLFHQSMLRQMGSDPRASNFQCTAQPYITLKPGRLHPLGGADLVTTNKPSKHK